MKLKDIFAPVLLIVLGLAFVAVALWVFLCKNKNAKAIRYKYKLGGLILSLSFFASACDGFPFGSSCYDPIPPDDFYFEHNGSTQFEKGDTVFFQVEEPSYSHYSYQIMDSISQEKLQEGLLEHIKDKNRYLIPIDTLFDYTGVCEILIYGESSEEIKQERYVYS
ncbi:hypothetical protein LJC16_04180, partial [Bacteroidales bacterium OttesenSCG-928-C19]|nr:hypothetical protein [Bacteroidales bacterium OttesenSCG-928-C19]